jgi:broad specificity phosphatase PhoE
VQSGRCQVRITVRLFKMAKLFLIKHARPEVDPRTPSEQWRLGAEGRAGAERLAGRLAGLGFTRLYSSSEPKALETAQSVARTMDLSVVQMPDLGEHDRRNVPHMESREFISMVALFFKEPGRRVLGEETADEAYGRFAAGVDGVLKEAGGADVAVVSHGTVISLFAQRRAGEEPFGLWRRMGLPSYIVFDVETWKVAEVCERV